ncbi:TonB-dependent receptor [Selenomonas sp. F0473]|uniref:TonB-dependent receptor n=1 Tax=Selenomonas sp. F0473 TaxID=999423 RepID=UPI00029DD7BC|nr:TonB-dependent receptor plug domain-containing protein [Selenomonas sp. F0473]EKU71022.1 hypothetical protein HMPREF9161_01116 [Selenomonas sp. F0473]
MNRKGKMRLTLGVLLSLSIYAGGADVYAEKTADADSAKDGSASQTYVTKDIEVEGEATRDYFGNEITEQSYYRTGGDVTVIDRKTLDRRHYDQLTDALRQVPGVLVRSPGFHNGEYNEQSNGHNVVGINGDDRVIILVDGRRMDNGAFNPISQSSTSSTKVSVDINHTINMNSIEKIEVMKGPGASFYGSDATGGVINIITRKGAKKPVGELDISTGSWGKHNYRLSYSGTSGDNKLKYFTSVTREMSGDSKFHDGLTGKDQTYPFTRYRDDSANIRLDYDFDKIHNLRFNYNHMQSDAAYPVVAPDYRYLNPQDWPCSITEGGGTLATPGFRNRWPIVRAAAGAYNAYNKNNFDLSYTFSRENGMESFVRVYDQHERYWGS